MFRLLVIVQIRDQGGQRTYHSTKGDQSDKSIRGQQAQTDDQGLP